MDSQPKPTPREASSARTSSGDAKTIPAFQGPPDTARMFDAGDDRTLPALDAAAPRGPALPTLASPTSGPETSTPAVTTEAQDIEQTRGPRRYQPGPVLGAGGMGEVRLYVDRRVGRRIAKKTLHAAIDSAPARDRFLREVRIQGQLEHPAVVPVYDLDVDEDGQIYFTMKRVRGQTLEQVLERLRAEEPEAVRRYTTRRLLSAFAQVCFAVHYAHTRSVLHRDLKPGNIMLGDFGEVYVLDWGLAKVTGETSLESLPDEAPASAPSAVVGASGSLTVAGTVFGTLAYMAPEQILGSGAGADARADIYALGAILFEILTRQRLRQALELAPLVRELHSGKVPRPSDRVADLPPELDALCEKALAIDPDERLASARELAEALEHYLDGDYDLRLRRELSAKHAAAARRRVEEATARDAGTAQVEALREAMKALVLDAAQPEAQRLLVDVLTNVSGEPPPEAKAAIEAAALRSRAHNARMGTRGLLSWLAVLPLVMLIGVKSWPVVGAMALLTAVSALMTRRMSREGGYTSAEATVLAVIVAAVVGLTSAYLGPFTLMPTCAATASLLFLTASTRRERPALAVIFVAGALLPYLAEIFGVFPRAYAFEPGRIVIFARAVELPQWPTMAAMLYSTLSFVVLAVVLVGSMRDALSKSEQRNFLQAWYLRQLFPAAAGK